MALVDGDPSGLSILSTYMNGSIAMRHESDRLAAGDRVKWVGIHLSELSRWASTQMVSDVQEMICKQIGNRQRFTLAHHESRREKGMSPGISHTAMKAMLYRP